MRKEQFRLIQNENRQSNPTTRPPLSLVKYSKIKNKTPQTTTSAAETVVKLTSVSWQVPCIFSSDYVLLSNYTLV